MAEQQQDQNFSYYQDYYQFQGRSEWIERIWSEAFGAQYPEGLHHYGYLTRHDLDTIAQHLNAPPGSALLDIGCGKGGPGLWLAQQLQLQLTGIDIVPEAVAQARAFTPGFQLQHPATFLEGAFHDIPCESGTFDAAICIDSLWAARDKLEALRNIRRVLKPGARFIFTYWDLLALDALPYFLHTGFDLVTREECPDWKENQRRVYEGILAHEAELRAEMGPAANMPIYEATASPAYLDQSIRRIYVMVAR